MSKQSLLPVLLASARAPTVLGKPALELWLTVWYARVRRLLRGPA